MKTNLKSNYNTNTKTFSQWNNLFRDYFHISIQDPLDKKELRLNEFLFYMKTSECYFKRSYDEVNTCIDYVSRIYK